MGKSANAVLARVRAMYGKRLLAADYANLLACSSNAEMAVYLKNKTAYGDIFAPNTGMEITSESIEFSLNKEMANRLQKICSFERMVDDKFYDYYVLKSDITLILSAARTLVSTASMATSYMPSGFFIEHSALNVPKLYNARSAAQLIEALGHTRYYPVAKKFIGADGMFDFSMVEIHLTRFYAQTAFEMSKAFPSKSAKELRELVSLEIDNLNIAQIIRLKKRGADKKEILSKLIFDYGTLSKAKLVSMLETSTDAELVEKLAATKLGKGFEVADLIYPEFVFKKNTYKINKRFLRFSANPDIAVIAYFNLLKIEIENITHIIEGKRYKMNTEQISAFLTDIE